ncbi:helix-turn-helix transcriptional regulator [Psychrobacter sanguinis]|uniref:WYL domain-containing protein n=1 Tax=Psychrobacter sanguinis TaxID=861445 RepID=A0A844LZY6_9GAMM|nr:WYL domain-containing protein [Psychrobacter sanguinis]MUG32085.1 WYL domain-containing protein [Psychrobacter sanguinis]
MSAHPISNYKKSERLFALYQCLPRSKAQALSLTELMDKYASDTDNVANQRKNLENDLFSLNQIFTDIFYSQALVRIPAWGQNISGQTARFYIEPDFSIDAINEQTVFFWEMLSNYTANYLPVSFQQTLHHKLAHIRKREKVRFHQSALGQWQEHLINLPSVVQAPTIDNQVLAGIHQALLNKTQLCIVYQNKWQQQPKQRVVYPKGLVFIDNMMYLTGFNPVDEHIDDEVLLKAHRNFAVNRIKEAVVIDKPMPDWVDRDSFMLTHLHKLGKLEPTNNHEIKLVLKVQKYACQHLFERPLADNQQIERIDDNWNRVTATVANTQRLEDWLVSMSQLAVVEAPNELRAAVRDRLLSAIELYKD